MVARNEADISQAERDEARRYSLLIQWSDEDQVYVVSVPELPGCHTHGRTHEEAAAMDEEAIAVWLTGLRATGQPVPEPQGYMAAVSVH